MDNARLCLVLNPKSGISQSAFRGNPLQDIVNFFIDKKISINIKTTTKPEDGSLMAKEAVQQGYTHIIACGGDGTINQVLNGIIEYDVIMGIIPMGTENVLCKAMKVPLNITEACRHFIESPIKTMDVGIANGQHFLIMSGIGLDAHVILEMEPEVKNLLGSLGFIIKGAATLIFDEKKYRSVVKIILHDKGIEFETSAWLVLAGNLPYYSGTIKLAINAEPDDGMLDIVVFPFSNENPIANQVLSVFMENHIDKNEIKYFKSSDFEIITEPEVYCHIDGEILGKTPVKYSVRKKALKIKF